jgi:hypothetical protein
VKNHSDIIEIFWVSPRNDFVWNALNPKNSNKMFDRYGTVEDKQMIGLKNFDRPTS